MSELLFVQIYITFKVLHGDVTCDDVLDNFKEYINTNIFEHQINKNKIDIWFVTTESPDQIKTICDDVKSSLEESGDARLVYKIVSIEL